MIRKFLKINICVIAVLCVLCSSLTAFAVEGDLDFDFNIQPEIPTTQEETVPVETEQETERETEKEIETETEKKPNKETTEKPTERPTQKPTERETTERQNNEPDNNGWEGNGNAQPDEPTTKKETTQATTEEGLKKGQFYVYLERNNGQRRLKTLMNKKGYVVEPEEPFREGYIFSGWYADSKFKKPWNFMTDKADKSMTIYAKWTAKGDTVVYDIIIQDTVGGTLEVNPQKASAGEPVVITVIPEEGKRLVQGSIIINGENTDFLNFVMPDSNVTISATFEDVPEQQEAPIEKSKLPLFAIIGVLALVIIGVIVVITRQRRDFNADLDPDEDIFATDDEEDDGSWIDESIVVEDGFVEGKKVVENTEPDYGGPDLDENDFE